VGIHDDTEASYPYNSVNVVISPSGPTP